MSAQELVYLTLREAADRVRQRQVSPVELLDAVLARTQALEPQINAYITPMFDQARAAAGGRARDHRGAVPRAPARHPHRLQGQLLDPRRADDGWVVSSWPSSYPPRTPR